MRFEDLIVKELEKLERENPEALEKPFIATFQRKLTGRELLEKLRKGKRLEEV